MISRLLLVLPLAALTAVACSSSSGSGSGSSGTTPCNENPWQCPAGQTCWPTDQSSFACLNVGTGKPGDPCTATVGMPSCGANLDCLQTQAASAGTCVAYCSESDPSHACPTGVQCLSAYLGSTSGPKFSVCAPAVANQDAGSDSGSGSSSGGSGSSSGTSSDSGSGAG